MADHDSMKQLKVEECDKAVQELSDEGVCNLLRAAFNRGWKAGRKAQKERDEDAIHGLYQSGLTDAWEAGRKMMEMSTADLLEVFDCINVFANYEPQDAIAKLHKWEAEQERNESDCTDIEMPKRWFEIDVCNTRAFKCPICGKITSENCYGCPYYRDELE